MADEIKLVADVRTELGKGPTGRLRKQGRTPGVMYGAGVDPTAVSVDSLELFRALHTDAGMNALIHLTVQDDEHLTVARDVQRHAVLGDVMHIDFYAVSRDQRIHVEVPIVLINDEETKKAGGVVTTVLHALPITCTPLNVPNSFEIDLTGMEIGDVRRVEDITLPAGAELDIDPDRTVVTVNAPTVEEEPEPTEEELEAALEAEGAEDGEDGEAADDSAGEGGDE